MQSTKLSRVPLVIVTVLVAAALGYWAYLHDGTRQPSDSALEPAATSAAETADFDRESPRRRVQPADIDANGFAERLLAMPEAARNQVFWLTLRDAGLECEEVQSADRFGAAAWLARCGEPWAYEVMVDERGQLSARPAPYGDFQFPSRGVLPDGQAPSERLDDLR